MIKNKMAQHLKGWLMVFGRVAIIMGSDSDLRAMSEAARVLEKFGIGYKMDIVSAHRTTEKAIDFAKNCHKEFDVVIAGAGGAAHLAGVVASLTTLPVIGVPMKTETLSGVDSLYSIVQMPGGVPVATVGIGNAKNAALLAVRILALENRVLAKKLEDFMKGQAEEVLEKAKKLEAMGWEKFLETK